MQNYTDDQLKLAILDASDQRNIFIRTAYSLEDIDSSAIRSLRTLLYHLPDQQDDWQECSWDDILHTDERVKAEYISGTVIEGIPDGISNNGIYLVDGNSIPFSTDARWYRIPAPVVAPDPAEHPVIIDEMGEPWFWVGLDDDYHSHTRPSTFRSPSDFTFWTPAKVVSADE